MEDKRGGEVVENYGKCIWRKKGGPRGSRVTADLWVILVLYLALRVRYVSKRKDEEKKGLKLNAASFIRSWRVGLLA